MEQRMPFSSIPSFILKIWQYKHHPSELQLRNINMLITKHVQVVRCSTLIESQSYLLIYQRFFNEIVYLDKIIEHLYADKYPNATALAKDMEEYMIGRKSSQS